MTIKSSEIWLISRIYFTLTPYTTKIIPHLKLQFQSVDGVIVLHLVLDEIVLGLLHLLQYVVVGEVDFFDLVHLRI